MLHARLTRGIKYFYLFTSLRRFVTCRLWYFTQRTPQLLFIKNNIEIIHARVESGAGMFHASINSQGRIIHGATNFDDACQPLRRGFPWARCQDILSTTAGCGADRDADRLRTKKTRMWANAQPDGRPAEHRWRPLFNAAKFGWRPLLDAVQ